MRGESFNRVVPVTLQVAPETALWKPLTKFVIRIPRVWDGDLATSGMQLADIADTSYYCCANPPVQCG
jgi:hypothetical protein